MGKVHGRKILKGPIAILTATEARTSGNQLAMAWRFDRCQQTAPPATTLVFETKNLNQGLGRWWWWSEFEGDNAGYWLEVILRPEVAPRQWSSSLKSGKNHSDNHNGKLPEIKLIFGWQQWWWALIPVEKSSQGHWLHISSRCLADGKRMAENAWKDHGVENRKEKN